MAINRHTFRLTAALTGLLAATLLPAAEPPQTVISNGQIKARIYLPDGKAGYYRSTRFDWGGVIGSLKYKGHEFYSPWFYRIDPTVYDLAYDQKGVVSAPFTAMVGPGEEFGTDGGALGFAEQSRCTTRGLVALYPVPHRIHGIRNGATSQTDRTQQILGLCIAHALSNSGLFL